MSRFTNLLAQVKNKDSQLWKDLEREFKVLASRRSFELNFERHQPETTLLYQIVQEYWTEFQAELASHGGYLPAYITKEFDEYLKCGGA